MELLALILCLQNAEEYLPMKPGPSWRYVEPNRTDINKKSNVLISISAVRMQKVKDTDCLVFETNAEGFFLFQQLWLSSDKDGIKIHKLRRGAVDYEFETPEVFLKSPLKKGSTWKGKAPSGSTFECTCETDDETHEVYLGKIQKVKRVSFKFADVTGTAWFAKGVGPIRFKFTWDVKQTNQKFTREVEMSDCNGIPSIEFIYECPKCKKTKEVPADCETCSMPMARVPKDKSYRDNLAGKDVLEKLTKVYPDDKVKYDFSDGGKRGKVTTLKEALNMLLGQTKIPYEIDPKIAKMADEHLLNGKGECASVKECLEEKILKPLGLKWEIRDGKIFITK